jgi:hypothetical protein
VDLSALINPANPKKLFKNMKSIGHGGFADVCSAWNAVTNERVCLVFVSVLCCVLMRQLLFKVVVKKIKLTNMNMKYVLEECITHKSRWFVCVVLCCAVLCCVGVVCC